MPAAATAGKAKTNGKQSGQERPRLRPRRRRNRQREAAAAQRVARGVARRLHGEAPGGVGTGSTATSPRRSTTVVGWNAHVLEEIERTSSVVGLDGRLAANAPSSKHPVRGARSCWPSTGSSTTSTHPIAETSRVLGAVARGDLSQQMALEADGRPLKGEFLRTARTINTMVDQLNAFAGEVTRVAREVGSEGNLGGQAHVRGVAGTWKDLTDSVNSMAGNLTSQVRNIAEVTTAVANGNLSKKITVEARGEILQLKETINTMVDQLNTFAAEVTRVAREVGSEGRLGGKPTCAASPARGKTSPTPSTRWPATSPAQVRNIAEVTTAVANGDLSKKITVDVRGEVLELKGTINTMVDQLNAFAGEVTRVAREVGTEGQARRPGRRREASPAPGRTSPTRVNSMARNLTGQVRNIADVTTAVAKGDLSKKITVDVKGEILELKDTINTMVDQLNARSPAK